MIRATGFICLLLCASSSLVLAADTPVTEKVAPTVYHRTAFLGDSITDGDTYPKLVRNALASAGLPAMVAINAGIGGDTAHGMRARLERDVLEFHPTLVTLSCGANDAARGVTPEAYERDVRAIAQRLRQEHIPLTLLTPNIVGPGFEKKRKDLDAYEAILRQIAKDFGLRVAEVNVRQREDTAAGHVELAPDDVHPNWRGQQMIARAVLDAMGYTAVKVPETIADAPLPGLIPMWRFRREQPNEEPLNEARAAGLKPDDAWLTLKLPETEPMPNIDLNNHWLDAYRGQGASVSLQQQKPPGKFIGVATIKSASQRRMQFHTGADLDEIWLNGKRIYKNTGFRGYHIGRESVAAVLEQGDNQVVIKTSGVFFLSVTDSAMWHENQ